MRPPKPEFSHILPVDRIPAKGSFEKLAAEAKECEALARRMDVPVIHSLSAVLEVRPWRGVGLKVSGSLKVELEQVSVISLEAFKSNLELPVERFYLPPGAPTAASEDEIDVIEHGEIDLGEIVAETLGLLLDPYPRKPGEEFDGFDSDGQPEAKISPFARLQPDDDK
jgi:uncharacterized metal-binding protein YceD (DUF177 family)